MKTYRIFIGTLVFCLCFLSGCDRDRLSDQSNFTDAATERMGKGNGNGNGGGNSDGGELFRVVFTGNVSYTGGNYSIDDLSGQNGVLRTVEQVYVSVAKKSKKYIQLVSIPCPDVEITSASATGLDTLDNDCLGEEVCMSTYLRQYDLKNDRRKIFANLHIVGGRVNIRGFIEDQAPGQESIMPQSVGDTVFVTLDRIRVLMGPGSPCEMDHHFFNDDNGNGLYDGGLILLDQIPDQSLIIVKLDPETFDPCDPAIGCE